jgi:hypothetical protein
MRKKVRFSDVLKLVILRFKYELREAGKAAGYAMRR